MMSFLKKVAIFAFILLAAGAAMMFSEKNGRATDGKKNGPRYREVVVTRGTFQEVVMADGSVKPINRIEIKSKASGRIEDLPLEEGGLVQKGDLLARLDQEDEASAVAQAEADLDVARAELKQAKRMFNRRNKLYRKKIISEEERDEIELRLAVARGKLIQASTVLDRSKERLSDSIVRSPIDGIILQKYVEEGQIIASGVSSFSEGTPIVDIAAMGSVYIEAGINEIDIGKIKIGQSGMVVAEAYPGLKFPGKIVRIAPEARIEQNVTLFDVVVEVENLAAKLKSGMNAQVKITLFKRDDVLIIPVVALQKGKADSKRGRGREVLLKEGNDFTFKKVEVGRTSFKEAEILGGLSEGDVLGIPMTSRLKAENERLEKMLKRSRSFGGGRGNQRKKKR